MRGPRYYDVVIRPCGFIKAVHVHDMRRPSQTRVTGNEQSTAARSASPPKTSAAPSLHRGL